MPKPRGYARVEYLAVKPEIEELLQRGHTVAFVYRQLSREGRISMGYALFCDYARGNGQRLPRKGRHRQIREAPAPSAQVPASQAEGVPMPRRPNPLSSDTEKFQPVDFDFPNQAKKDV